MESRVDPTVVLTAKKIAILRHLAAGRSVREIAMLVGISVDTVYEHIEAIRRRVGAHSNPELVRIALHHGFIPTES
jgi:DNA-binding CsgD family transcriptional regulator